jgi:phosphatidylserine decarboxylase
MTIRQTLLRCLPLDTLNFALTNLIPRVLVTRFIGWFSQIQHPLVRTASIFVWKRFSDLDLSEAKKQHFTSMHDCFIRELKPGARPIDANPNLGISPCDAIVGAQGRVVDGMLIQAKQHRYTLAELLANRDLADYYEGGSYVTLRITASMYHRFHAPCDGEVKKVTYIAGDAWNVNPPALERVPRLFCRNERAVIEISRGDSQNLVTLVPVAAILVASIRLHFADVLLHLRHRGPNVIDCAARLSKGEEMGWFQHGSTIIALLPKAYELCESARSGKTIRAGQPLFRIA